jgi:hypothetical protein
MIGGLLVSFAISGVGIHGSTFGLPVSAIVRVVDLYFGQKGGSVYISVVRVALLLLLFKVLSGR